MKSDKKEFSRYIVNGLAATIIHYFVFLFNLKILNFESAGLANLLASFFGIIVSFLGSRYYVFKKITQNILNQAIKFVMLYSFIALIHAATLWLLVDTYSLNYNLGFLIAIGLQFSLSFLGNKLWVFQK